ncbi:DUF5692 family protein [Fusibacter tunisiensis]|uniref:Uncharacterized protein n=1 Tax=Fusibacter tunisiensis TaxID=1008308 RepID=A0ABS2MTW3_9FIRM|nr:DUF5692 family protein [Fusibacter tunisiensis]MBM7562790.1 hypothetical protein [Fusibacter tunisiensis]
MGLLFEKGDLTSLIGILVFIATFVIINEVSRKSLKLSILAYGVLPLAAFVLIMTGVLGSPTGKTWFGWVKVVSALIGVYGFLLIRFTKLGQNRFAAIFPVSILSINIAEAVYRELEVYWTYKTLTTDAGGILIMGGPWNLMNAAAGILCIVTLTGFSGIRVSKSSSKDMLWPDMTWLYIVGYTIWNFAYVYNCISTRALYAGFGILIAAMIAEFFFKKGAWLQHRAQILSLYALFSLSFDFQASSLFNITPNYTQTNLITLGIVSIAVNLGVFAIMVYTIMKHKRNPLKQEIYGHTSYYKQTMRTE